jgi:hypothetical protein
MTALATLSLFVAVALVALVSYQFGVTVSDYRHETARMTRKWKIFDLCTEVLREPFAGISELALTLSAVGHNSVANVIDRLVLEIHTGRTRATALHRRAQRAEGLLARRATRDAKRAAKIEEALDLVDDEPTKAYDLLYDLFRKTGEHDLALVLSVLLVDARLDVEIEHRTRARKFHRRAQKAEGEAERAQRQLANILSWSPDAKWQGRASRRAVEDYLAHELQKVNHAEAFVYISAGDFRVFARDSDLIIDRLLEIENSVNELLKTSISLHAWSHHGSLASCVAWSAGDARYAYPLCPEAEEALAKCHDGSVYDDPPSDVVAAQVTSIDYAIPGADRTVTPMPPIPVNGYWTSTLTAGGNALDILPAAKPLSALPDIFRPVGPPMCGNTSPGNWDDPDDFPVTCSHEKGHEGKHAGGTRCGTIEWGFFEPTEPVVKVGQ